LRRHNTIRLSPRLSCEGKNLHDATSIFLKIKDVLGDLCLRKDDQWGVLGDLCLRKDDQWDALGDLCIRKDDQWGVLGDLCLRKDDQWIQLPPQPVATQHYRLFKNASSAALFAADISV